jgi:hypothetical protein
MAQWWRLSAHPPHQTNVTQVSKLAP